MGSHSLRFGPPLEAASGFGASLSLGYGVVHLIYHGSTEWLLRLENQPRRALKPIWPTLREVTWPPQVLLRPRDLSPLAHEINANSRFVRRPSVGG
jgi:hypothetical protein